MGVKYKYIYEDVQNVIFWCTRVAVLQILLIVLYMFVWLKEDLRTPISGSPSADILMNNTHAPVDAGLIKAGYCIKQGGVVCYLYWPVFCSLEQTDWWQYYNTIKSVITLSLAVIDLIKGTVCHYAVAVLRLIPKCLISGGYRESRIVAFESLISGHQAWIIMITIFIFCALHQVLILIARLELNLASKSNTRAYLIFIQQCFNFKFNISLN